MAILDEEELPYAPTESGLSALDRADLASDEGGGSGDDYSALGYGGAPPSQAPSLPAARLRSPRVQQLIDQTQQMIAQRTRPGLSDANVRARVSDPAYVDSLKTEPVQIETEPPPKEGAPGGMGGILGRGILRATEGLKQGKDVAEGKKPRDSDVPLADYEQPLELSDFGDPMMTAKKLWYGLGKSYPAVALSVAGSMVGGAVGSAVPVIGSVAGGVGGAAVGMGAGAMLGEIGPSYHSELQALREANPDRELTKEETDKAWNSAVVRTGEAGAVGAASMLLFGAGKPLGDALKTLLTPVVEGAIKPVAGIPLRAGIQAVGQPAINVAGEVGVNAIEGKPLDTNLGQAIAGGIANVVPDVAGQLGGRALGRVFRGKPGVNPDQEAALTAPTAGTQGELPLEGGAGARPPPEQPTLPGMDMPQGPPGGPTIPPGAPPGPAGRRYDVPPEEPLPPTQPPGSPPRPAPPGAGPSVVPDAAQMRLPDITGPGRQPLGDQTFTPRPPESVQPELPLPEPPQRGATAGAGAPVQGPQLGLPLDEVNVGGERIPASAPIRQTAADFERRVGQREIGGQRIPGETPMAGFEDATAPPLVGPAMRPIGRVGEEPAIPPGRPTREQGQLDLIGMKTQEGWLLERDHTGPGVVVKNPAGAVIAIGDTQEQALAFARARHPDQISAAVPEGGARFKAEPAAKAAAGPETVAQYVDDYIAGRGRDSAAHEQFAANNAEAIEAEFQSRRAAETPAAAAAEKAKPTETGTTAVTPEVAVEQPAAKPLTKAEQRKAAAQEKLAEVKAKAAEEAVTETAGKSVRKKPPSETVTKTVEPTEKSAPAKNVEVTTGGKEAAALAAYDQATKDWTAGKISQVELGRAKAAYEQAVREAEGGGTRTKTGAFTMGEGEELPAKPAQPMTSSSTPMSREAGAQIRGELSEQRGKQMPTPREFTLPEGESKLRHAWRLVTGLLKGDVDIDRANELYGTKAEGTRGRKRTFQNLAAVARDALRQAENPEIEVSTRAKMKAMEDAGTVTTEAYKQLNVHLDVLEAARLNKNKLAVLVKELDDIERGAPPALKSRGGVEALLNEALARSEGDAMLYRASRPEVNAPLLAKLEKGGGNKLHDLLDTVINTDGVNKLSPHLSTLAKVLRRILPNLDVISRDIPADPDGTRVYGQYVPTAAGGHIEMDPAVIRQRSPAGAVITLLHETLHGATYDYVKYLFDTSEINLTSRQLAHKVALRELANEVNRVLVSPDVNLTPVSRRSLGYATHEYEGAPHELITQIFTRPDVLSVLAQTKASDRLKSALSNAGMDGRGTSSLWDGFKNVVRSVFGLRKADFPDSILDTVFRPLTEITETGAKYRAEAVKAKNDSIRVSDQSLGPLGSRDGWSRDGLNFASRMWTNAKSVSGRVTMRGAFEAATTTAIRDFIKNDVPSVVSHFEQLRKVTRASELERTRTVITHGPNGEERAEPNIDKATRLHNEMREGPDAKPLGQLMTDVTLAGMSVIDPKRNAHLRTQEEINTQLAFQHRFDALDPRAKQTYREVNEYHDEIYRAEREAKVKSLVDLAFGTMTEPEKQVIREQMRTRQGVMDVLNRPDATPVARTMGKLWDDKKALVKLIAESQEGGFVDGDYFPARRHGEYVVSAGEHNKPGYIVQMFDTASEAHTYRDELMSKRNDVSQVFVKSQTRARDMISPAALTTLDRAMERAGLTGNSADIMRDMYAAQMIQAGTRQAARTMRREGIAGASADQARNILGDFLAYTSRIGHLMHGADAARSWYDADKEARALHAPGSGASPQRVANAQLGVEELRRRMVPADGDTSADWMGRGARRLTTLTVLNTLIRPAHFFMQLAGTHAAASSMIGARHGFASSAYAVTRAFAQLSGTAGGAIGRNTMAAWNRELKAANWDVAKLYRERLKRPGSGIAAAHADLLIDRLDQASLVNHTWVREIQRLAGPQGFGGKDFNFISRFLDVAGAGEHAVDSAMRVATAKAAFELEYRRNGGHLNEALDYSVEMAERTQPDYSRHNKSRITTAQGSLGRIAPLTTQYRQFGLHMYGVQGNLLAEGVRAAKGSAERAEAFKAIAYLQASHALMWAGVGSSVFGSLPMMAGLGLYDLLNPWDPTNRAHTNAELEVASRNWVRDMTGSKTVADIFAHGVPMFFGADTHRSLQFTNLLTPPELRSFNKPDVLSFLAQAITGASGDTAAGMVDGMSRIVSGDVKAETIAKLLPRIVRDPVEALVWGQQGVKTGKGDLTIVRPENLSTRDLILKGIGFIPETVGTAREARAAINLSQTTQREITTSILDKLVRTAPAERKEALAEITRYNSSVPPEQRITGQQIQSRFREQAKINAQPDLFGMRVPKRDVGAERSLVRFAQP